MIVITVSLVMIHTTAIALPEVKYSGVTKNNIPLLIDNFLKQTTRNPDIIVLRTSDNG